MAQHGHVRSTFPFGYTGPWQLYSTVMGRDLGTYADFAACRQAAVTSPDLACKPVAIASPDTPTPPIVQPPVVTPPVMNGAFPIDASVLPRGSSGYGFDRLQATSELAPLSDIGAFRIVCQYSHMAFDDPIVYPGRPGASHLHTFFGNTGANATSNAQSILGTGNSTCDGGTVNRSAYWVPTMIDTTTGKPVVPDGAVFYYKQGYLLNPSSIIQPLPAGLRMIAGDPTSSRPGGPIATFSCLGGPNPANEQKGSAIPNCDVGSQLRQTITFPQCWDGRNLDSPDHKSHMSYPVGIAQAPWYVCPATHPVPLTEISFNISYTVQTANATRSWRLSSDTYDRNLPAGYSSHGDWFNGWRKDISDTWNAACIQARRNCGTDLIGDGRKVY
jgi:hypothetical protein